MKIVKSLLKNKINLRSEMDYPIKGVEFIDINPLILDKDLLKEIVTLFVKEIKKYNVDYVVSPEARGFLFGMSIADNLNSGCVPVRKKGKLAPSTVEISFDYEKEYGKDSFELPKLVNDTYKGKKFYIVDDIYATGNTIKSIKKAIESLGGLVVGISTVINIIDLNNDKNVFSLIDLIEDK